MRNWRIRRYIKTDTINPHYVYLRYSPHSVQHDVYEFKRPEQFVVKFSHSLKFLLEIRIIRWMSHLL